MSKAIYTVKMQAPSILPYDEEPRKIALTFISYDKASDFIHAATLAGYIHINPRTWYHGTTRFSDTDEAVATMVQFLG